MARRTPSEARRWGRARGGLIWILVAAGGAWTASPASAQTDYYNLDKSRPLLVEDAYATERYAFELQLAPLTFSGAPGALFYEPSLELKYGILPGMELSGGVGAHLTRSGGETTGSIDEVEISSLYNLNSETLGVPAFGVRVTGHLPLEDDESASVEVKGILTRVIGGPLRAHANGAWVLGEDQAERWWAGLALDWVLPFRSLLFLGETYYAHPDEAGADGRIHSAAGLRYQLGPRTGLDFGAGRDWSGEGTLDWHVTFGLTTALGFRSLMPG